MDNNLFYLIIALIVIVLLVSLIGYLDNTPAKNVEAVWKNFAKNKGLNYTSGNILDAPMYSGVYQGFYCKIELIPVGCFEAGSIYFYTNIQVHLNSFSNNFSDYIFMRRDSFLLKSNLARQNREFYIGSRPKELAYIIDDAGKLELELLNSPIYQLQFESGKVNCYICGFEENTSMLNSCFDIVYRLATSIDKYYYVSQTKK